MPWHHWPDMEQHRSSFKRFCLRLWWLALLAPALACACSTASDPTPADATSPARVVTETSPLPTAPSGSTPLAPTVAVTPAPSLTPTASVPRDALPNKLGIHLLLDDGRSAWPVDVWPEHLAYARRAVGEWGYVTELVRSDDLDPERWQVFFDLCTELHLTPILRLATTYDREAGWWVAPQPDGDGTYRNLVARYAAFVAALDWPTGEHYVIVGNEPNHGNEWSGRPDPAAYARFMIDVADALHAADPAVRVLNAGLDPYTPHTGSLPFIDGMFYMDEETFLDEMVAAYPDVFTRLDAWASHSYPTGPLTEGPWQQTLQMDLINDAVNPEHVTPPEGISNRGINGYEWELFKLSTYGVPQLPVMITETGWRHAESTDPEATDNGRPLPDAALVAQYLDLALRGNGGRYPQYPEEGWTPWLVDPRVQAVTPFALDGYPAEWGHTNWLALSEDGEVLGTYAPFDVLATEGAQP
jgi:hypothetical protein